MHSILHYLAPKKIANRLILAIAFLVVTVGAVFGLLQIRTQEQQLLDTILIGADQLSNGITSATWHAMLANDRAAAYEIMQTIATRQGIDRIRIYNREGRVMYSTDPADTGRVTPDAETCAICHSSPKPVSLVNPRDRSRIFTPSDGRRGLAMVTPIYNEPACSNADCHAHPARVKVLGVLDVAYRLDNVDLLVADMRKGMLVTTMASTLIIGLFLAFFVRSTVHKPITKLIEGTRAVSRMQLDRPLSIRAEGELGELAESFELMRQRLQAAVKDLNELTENLEKKVRLRTEELSAINQKLSQSDRLASLGQLAASVAHEINNPIAGVLTLATLLERITTEKGVPQDRVPEVRTYLSQIATETARVGRIVTDLLAFSRRSTPQQVPADLNAVVRRTISLLEHRLQLMGVALEVVLDEHLPNAKCDTSQMQQVIVNLVMNAAEATIAKGSGRVGVRTVHLRNEHHIVLEVTDNGDGIPVEIQRKIFDPFFTTKGEGKGTGLGLAVVYGIVNAHGGEIKVDSTVSVGSTFRVILPEPAEAAASGRA